MGLTTSKIKMKKFKEVNDTAAAAVSTQQQRSTLIDEKKAEKYKVERKPRGVFILEDPKEERVEEYKFIKRLGAPGHFGEAWKAERKLKDGKTHACAVKRISKARFMTGGKRTKKYLEVFRHEVKLMKKMKHRNVIEFYEAFEDKNFLYVSMELCEGGELFKLVERGKMTEQRAAGILYELLQGLKHIHDQDVAHCDLKPENFVFLHKGSDSPVKIIDFGMAKPVPPHVYLTQFAGTPYYIAPEILDGRYNTACDMWSMGIVMFLLLYGYPPFHASGHKEGSASTREVFKKIQKGFDPKIRKGYGAWFPRGFNVSDEARDLIARLLTRDTKDRYTVDEMLAHPWFVRAKGYTDPIDPRVTQSLLEFRRANKFHNFVLYVLMDHVHPDEEEFVLKAFDAMDENHDGMISFQELKHAMKHIKSEKLHEIFDDIDENKDGMISLHELKMAYAQRKVLQKEERLWEAFSILDRKHDMSLSLSEIKQALLQNPKTKHLSCTEEEVERAFKEADVDKDGVVDYDEFLYAMGSSKAPPRAGTLPHQYWVRSSMSKMSDDES